MTKHIDEIKANACLIAAAPELLNALRDMLSHADTAYTAGDVPRGVGALAEKLGATPGGFIAAASRARAAITKATGAA